MILRAEFAAFASDNSAVGTTITASSTPSASTLTLTSAAVPLYVRCK